jgi:hypothetical protein
MSKFTLSELEVQADQIMNSFDFEKIQKHMEATNHQWYLGGGRMGVPDLTDLRVTARDLLTKAICSRDECTNVGTGGFVAYKLPWGMQLTFQLAWASGASAI